MNARNARYPFFEAARRAVEASGVDLATLIADADPAVERGRERIERALLEGTTEPEDPGRWSQRDELLSYPLARILVSLIDAPAAVRKYAEAEAATAQERFVEDFEAGAIGIQSAPDEPLSLEEFLDEFDLESDVTPERTRSGRDPAWFRVALGSYLTLADPGWGDRWRLVNRDLVDGSVRVEREELFELLREAVRRRVERGLPFSVRDTPDGEELAAALETEIESLRDLLSDRTVRTDIDTVAPDLFPPCIKHLLDRAERGAELEPHSRFALTAFLTGIGMQTDEIVAVYRASSVDEEAVRYQTEYLRDESGSQYAPPSCETMRAYGDCVNRDARCETISHPMVYYGRALVDADRAPDGDDANAD